MSELSRLGYLLAAAGLHALVWWGWAGSPAASVSVPGEKGEPVQVELVASAEGATAEPPPTQPAAAEPEPPPPAALPPQEPSAVPPSPPETVPEPAPAPAPRPTPVPRPRPAASPSPPTASPRLKPAAPLARTTAAGTPAPGAPGRGTAGTPGTAGAGPGRGDAAHATWRHRVQPAYPQAARLARQAGRVLVEVSVNALGQPTVVRVSAGSGYPALDQAALAAARASSYHPRRLGGIPLPDTITVPFTFRLEQAGGG